MEVLSATTYSGETTPGIVIITETGDIVTFVPPITWIDAIYMASFATAINPYPYENKTVIHIEDNVKKFDIELQTVTNQEGWDTGDVTALATAMKAIVGWLTDEISL
jgi:hypothetical protein